MNKPLCFVCMPFGKKMDPAGLTIDFDTVYYSVIAPAIQEAGLEALRADEEMNDGFIHRSMFERLMYCEYAVADLTTANANVFYELGIRHALRPWSTVIICASGSRLPFDVAPFRAMLYDLSKEGLPAIPEQARADLSVRLKNAVIHVNDKKQPIDSPLFSLIDGLPSVVDRIPREQLRSFYIQEQHISRIKSELEDARRMEQAAATAELRRIQQTLESIPNQPPQLMLDLLMCYRFVSAWDDMIKLVTRLPGELANNVTVHEQYALALNRSGQSDRAEQVLKALLKERGPSSETYGILGRVYKDRWKAALDNGKQVVARGWIRQAIKAYRSGFEADWRDAYPGINACTLMEALDPPDPYRLQLLPIVAYAVERKITLGNADYWDYATDLELAVHLDDQKRALEAVTQLVTAKPEQWQLETTLDSIQLIRQTRERRGQPMAWLQEVEEPLSQLIVQIGEDPS